MHSVIGSKSDRTQPGSQLRIILFGEPSVTYVGHTVRDVPMTGRCVLLLAYLVLNPNNRSRQRIAASLWPDSLDCESRASLRRTLHYVVRALPKAEMPWISKDAKRIAWNSLAPMWCDVDAFDRLSRDEATLAPAVDLYGGDFLAGDDTEWVIELRNRLRERQVEALRTLAERCRNRGDANGATAYYRRLLALDPFREDALRTLLGLLHARGDRARAAFVYHEFVKQLRDELGVDPMPETVSDYEQMARGLIPGHPSHADVRSLRIVGYE